MTILQRTCWCVIFILALLNVHCEPDSFVTTVENFVNSSADSPDLRLSWKHTFIWSSSANNEIDIHIQLSLRYLAEGWVERVDKDTLSQLCPTQQCGHCHGTGRHAHSGLFGEGPHNQSFSFPCPHCAGYGRLPSLRDCLLTDQQNGTWALQGDDLQVLVPPNVVKSQVLYYQPFHSTLLQMVTANLSRATAEREMGRIRLVIHDILPPALTVPKNPSRGFADLVEQSTRFEIDSNMSLRVVVPITPEEAVLGFERKLNLFREDGDALTENCEDLHIHRKSKPTLPDTTARLPLDVLFTRLCPHLQHNNDTSANENSTDLLLSPSLGADLKPLQLPFPPVAIELHFQVLNESLFQDAFMQYWNCSIVDVLDIQGDGNDDTIDLDALPSSEDRVLVMRKEISCEDTEFEEQRVAMFEEMASKKELNSKFHGWLNFLKQT